MTTDFKASQVQTSKVIVTGSFAGGGANQLLVYSIEADDSLSPNQGQIDSSVFDTSSGIGTDVFAFVSGGISQKDVGGSYGVSVFGGDVHISGNLTIDGTGGGGGGGGDGYWTSTVADSIFSTGSVLVRSDDGSGTTGASDYGSDIFFFVSGADGGRGTGGVSVFGGDLVVSGTLYAERQVIEVDEVANGQLLVSGNLVVSQSAEVKQGLSVNTSDETGYGLVVGGDGSFVSQITGTLEVTAGLSGSLTQLVDGTSYLIAGTGIGITTGSNGAVTIENTGGDSYWSSTTVDSIFATGSVLIRSDDGSGTDSASDYGADTFFFVSGAIKDRGTGGVAAFGGDTVVSGVLHALTTASIGDTDLVAPVDGYLHVVGGSDPSKGTFIDTGAYPRIQVIGGGGSFVSSEITNATVTLNNSGQRAILSVGFADGQLLADNTLILSSSGISNGIRAEGGSLLVRSDDGSFTTYATDYGTDNFLFVSGAIGGKDGATAGVATFGGDVVISGTLHGAPDFLRIGTDTQVTGALYVSGNLIAGDAPTIPPDVGFFVSGAAGGQSVFTESTALFTGDLVTSGNFHQLAGLRLSITPISSVTPAYTASILDYIIAVSASVGDGVTLPSGAQIGKSYIIKDVSGSATTDNIIISGTGGELIDGQLGETIAIDYGAIQVVYFGPGIGWGVI